MSRSPCPGIRVSVRAPERGQGDFKRHDRGGQLFALAMVFREAMAFQSWRCARYDIPQSGVLGPGRLNAHRFLRMSSALIELAPPSFSVASINMQSLLVIDRPAPAH